MPWFLPTKVEALKRGLTKTEPAAKAHRKEQSTATAESSPSSPALPSPPGDRPNAMPPASAPVLQAQRHAGNGAATALATGNVHWQAGCGDVTTKAEKGTDLAVGANTKARGGGGGGGDLSSAEDQRQNAAHEPPRGQSAGISSAAGDGRRARQRPGSSVAPSPEHLHPRDAFGIGSTGDATNITTKIEPICFGSFETKPDDRTGSGGPTSSTGRDTPANGDVGRNKRVSAATESEAERLLASLLLVDNAAVATAAGLPRSSPRQPEAFPIAMTTNAGGGAGQRSVTRDGESSHGGHHHQQQHHRRNLSHSPRPLATQAGPSPSLPSPLPPPSSGFHRNSAGSCTASFSSPCNAVPSTTLPPPRGEAAPPAGGAGYFASSSGVRVRL